LEAADPFLGLSELLILSLLLGGVALLTHQRTIGSTSYTDIITFCQVHSVSLAETFGLVTFFVGFIVFDVFATLAEDDAFEAISFCFASSITAAILFLAIAVDVQYYYLLSSVSGGEVTLRLLYADAVNNALCLLRILFC